MCSESQTATTTTHEALEAAPAERLGWWHEAREYVHSLRGITAPARWYLAGNFFIGMTWAIFMLLFNLYLQARGQSETLMGTVLSAQSLGGILLTLPAVAVVTRVSMRWLLPTVALIVGVGYAVMAIAEPAGAIVVASALVGGVITFMRVSSSPFLMKHSSARERSHVFSLSFAAMLGAGLVANAGAGFLQEVLTDTTGSEVTAYRAVLLLGAAMTLAAAFCLSRVPRGPAGERSERGPWRDFWHRKGRLIFRLTFPFFIVGMGAGLVIPFLNLYFANRFELSPKTVGFYYAVVQLLMVVGVMVGPVLARRYGMIRTVVYTEWASLPFMLILAFTWSLPLATLAFLARAALMNMGVPVANNYTMERVGEGDRALANSAMMLAWALSWAVTSLVGGILIEHFGFTPVLVISCVLYAVSSTTYFSFFRSEDLHAGVAFQATPRRGEP